MCFFSMITSVPPVPKPAENPCVPSPCGPNSQCRVVGSHSACSCLPNYIGRPPNCRPECVINAECASNLACRNERCVDPCPGSCGSYAKCTVVNHNPMCTCFPGYTGDATRGCSPVPAPCKLSLFLFLSKVFITFQIYFVKICNLCIARYTLMFKCV
jgi:hypothetical protein